MPTQTTKYNSAAGGMSTTIAVDQGQQVVVTLSKANGASVEPGVACQIMRAIGANYQAVPSLSGDNVLTNANTEVVLSAPGTYAVRMPAGFDLQIIEYR